MTTEDQKATAAEEAYQDYDFGALRVTDSEGWDTSDPLDHTRIVYLEASEDPDCSYRASFHVRFNEAGNIVEVYSLDLATGNYLGTCTTVYVPTGKDGKVFAIDLGRLSRDRGFVALTIEINGGTQFALVTDVIEAIAKVKEAGGRVVDASTDFEEIINSQYDGLAVLTTELA